MRAVLQRVSQANVVVADQVKGTIGKGIVALVAVEEADGQEDCEWLAGKISRLRIFDDTDGVMNLSVVEAGGDVLAISQFTLFASTRKGNRPSYVRAAGGDVAHHLYLEFVQRLEAGLGKKIQTGQFGAHMMVSLVNDGPVTIIIDSKSRE